MATTDVPPATFAVSSETTGTCHIPDTFHDTLSQGIAALDFARVWNTRGTVDGYRMTAHELEAAAVQFEALARSCRTFSADAVKAGIRAESCKRDSAVGAASNLADLHCAGCGAITSIPPLCGPCFATIGALAPIVTLEETAMDTTKHEQDAFNAGRARALAAASWVIDGNTKREHIARVVELLDDGDDIDPYLPPAPNLSGEWADDPTPLSLAREITGEDDPDPDVIDALADAFERGVADHFVQECERILRAAL